MTSRPDKLRPSRRRRAATPFDNLQGFQDFENLENLDERVSSSTETGGKRDLNTMPPQTPVAPKISSSSSSYSLPTPPSTGEHHRKSSGHRNAVRGFLAMPPSPTLPPPAPSPPPITANQRLLWQNTVQNKAPTSPKVPMMPSTPRIPREETPDLAPIPQSQLFCTCCENDSDTDADTGRGKRDRKGKQKLDRRDTRAVCCDVHGNAAATGRTLQHHKPNKYEAQREFFFFFFFFFVFFIVPFLSLAKASQPLSDVRPHHD